MKKITKCIIPIAGKSRELLPESKVVPKELYPINNKACIQYAIEEAINSGITDIVLVVDSFNNGVIKYLDRDLLLESNLDPNNKNEEFNNLKNILDKCNISIFRQNNELGSAQAIALTKEFIAGDDFSIIYPGDLIKSLDPALLELINIYNEKNTNVFGIKDINTDYISKYSLVDMDDNNKINNIYNSNNLLGANSTYALIGRYVVKNNIFDSFNHLKKGKNNKFNFDDVLKVSIKNNLSYAKIIDGEYFDLDNKVDYIKANISYLKDTEDKYELEDYLDNEYVKRNKTLSLKINTNKH